MVMLNLTVSPMFTDVFSTHVWLIGFHTFLLQILGGGVSSAFTVALSSQYLVSPLHSSAVTFTMFTWVPVSVTFASNSM